MSELELEMFEVYCGTMELGLDRLRAQLLGQMKPIKSLVPIANRVSNQVTAELAAEVLTILIYKTNHPDDNTLYFYKGWLETVIEYVLDSCPEEDHSLYSLVKLAALECRLVDEIIDNDTLRETRQIILHPPENLHEALEEAIWFLMEDAEKQQHLAFCVSGMVT